MQDFASHLRLCLEPVLGRHTTRTAVKLACEGLSLTPENLTWEHAPAICDALTPLLRTLLGRESTLAVCEEIQSRGGST